MALMRLSPAYKDYIWGGQRLAKEYNKDYDGDVLAESWELSCHPDGPSFISSGAYTGKTLQDFLNAEGKNALGENCSRYQEFPLLIKLIDAKESLSVQVHPDDEYALEHEGQYGKTEVWYIVDCAEEAFLYYGFKKDISRQELRERIQNNTLTEVLNPLPVQKGDVVFIEAGTIHAIGKNILIAEIQQNSNVTYRVFDYGRLGQDGKPRLLHIDKAMEVTDRRAKKRCRSMHPYIADCPYFTVEHLHLDGGYINRMEGIVDGKSFLSLLFLQGNGTIACGGEKLKYKKGESFFISASSGKYEITGTCEVLITYISDHT